MPIVLPTFSRQITMYALPGGGYSSVPPVSGLSFGSSALQVTSTADALANGIEMEISSDTYDFGAKAAGVTSHFQAGSYIKQNGVLNTSEVGASAPSVTVWEGQAGNVDIVTDELPHSYIDQIYRSTGKGNLTRAVAMANISASNKKMYLAFKAKVGSDFFRCYVVGYSGLSGTFQLDANRRRGEAVTIGGSKTGYITHIDSVNNLVTLEITGGSGGAAGINGLLVTGQVSGATLTIVATTSNVNYTTAPAVTKMFRLVYGDGTGARFWVITSHNANGTLDHDNWDETGTPIIDSSDLTGIGSPSQNPGQYGLVELEADFSGATGVVRYRFNNGTVYTIADIPIYMSGTKGLRLDNFGMETGDAGSLDTTLFGLSQDTAEIYADAHADGEQIIRVVLGDAATYGDCTKLVQQEIVSYDDTNNKIGYKFYPGEIDASSTYLYVIKDNFTSVHSTGVALS